MPYPVANNECRPSGASAFMRLAALAGLASLGVAIIFVPVVGGATVCVDDFVWIRMAHCSETLWRSLLESWPRHIFFRPVDIAANWLVNPSTLVLAPLLAVQLAGLAALSAGVVRVIMQCGARGFVAPAAALAWLWLHPATQLSVWSAGASSQTWSAAAGVWGVSILLAIASGTKDSSAGFWSLAAVSAIGVVSKELFVGWATAFGLMAFVIGFVSASGSGRDAGLRKTAPLMLAALLPSVLWVGARWCFSDFRDVTAGESAGLYAVQGPATVLKNLPMAMLGMFAQGPVHWARLLPLPWSAVPILGAAVSFGLAWTGGRSVESRRIPHLSAHVLAWSIGIGMIAVWPALTLRHISELYLLGPNALAAVLIGIGWDAVCQDPRQWRRLAGRVAGAALLTIAVIGFASRSYHFWITWGYARQLRERADSLVAARPPSDEVAIRVPASLFVGPMHSKYCVPPAVAAALPQTWETKKLVSPDLPSVTFIDGRENSPQPSASSVDLDVHVQPRVIW